MKWLAVVIVLAAVVWLAVRGGTGAGSPPLAVPAGEVTANSIPARELVATATTVTPRARERVEATSKQTEAASEVAQAVLRGRVVLIDELGIERHDADGSIELFPDTGEGGTGVQRPVSDGAFDVDVTGAVRVIVRCVVVDGRVALPTDSDTFELPSDAIEVRARLVPPVLLRVLNARNGSELTDVTVREGDNDGLGHPGDPRRLVLVAHGDSPLEIAPVSTFFRERWFVHSPGCAWQVLPVDRVAGGERQVRLSPGGDLELAVVGGPVPRGAWFRLRRADGERLPYAEVRARADRASRLEGLPVDTYDATVEFGPWTSARVLGSLEVVVVAGTRTRFVIPVEEQVEVERAGCSGVALVPEAWGFDELKVWASAQDRTVDDEPEARVERSGDRWAFEFAELPVGDWTIHVADRRQASTLESTLGVRLPPEGVTGLEVVIPPPATVVLTVGDARTGAAVELDRVYWFICDEDGNAKPPPIDVRADSTRIEWRAPVGTIVVGVQGDDYVPGSEQLSIHAGRNEINFDLEPSCSLLISFFDGDTRVPPPYMWFPGAPGSESDGTFEHLDGEGVPVSYGGGGRAGFRLVLSEAGRYRIAIPRFAGFLAVPDQVFTVERGVETRARVDLVRE